jgi:ubiquitin-conjugating enzyme E2 variant
MLLDLILGYLAADFGTGVFHFIEDNFFDENTPLIGDIIRDNRKHHDQPTEMLRYNYFQTTRVLFFVTLPLLIWFIWSPSVFIGTVWLASLHANQIHKLNHLPQKDRPGWFRVLQTCRLVQTQHFKHHQSFDSHYCVLTDLLNPILDGSKFWFFIASLFK